MHRNILLCCRKIAIFVLCLCLMDVVLGGLSRLLFFHQRSGKFYRIHAAMALANQRLFVFGSSHAASHYVPAVLEKELGLSCYNAGVLGQEILFHRTLESVILRRTTPEVIVLDVDPSMLYYSSDAYDRLAELRPFYYLYPEIIGPALDHRSNLETLFLQSKLYQYNSTLAHVIRYWVSPQPDSNGYRPAYGVMRAPTAEEEREEAATGRAFRANRKLDPVMIEALKRFSEDALRKNIHIFFFVSPGALPYDAEDNASLLKIKAIADETGVPLFDHRNDPGFLRNYMLFYDSGHLNDNGARLYSRMVAETIRQHLTAMSGQSLSGNRGLEPGS